MPPALNTQQLLAARKQILRAEAVLIRREIQANAARLKPAVDAIDLGRTVLRRALLYKSLAQELFGLGKILSSTQPVADSPAATPSRLASALQMLAAGWKLFAEPRSK
jgi:hypothetical protein